jgi:hypothetical protein
VPTPTRSTLSEGWQALKKLAIFATVSLGLVVCTTDRIRVVRISSTLLPMAQMIFVPPASIAATVMAFLNAALQGQSVY